MSSPLLYPVLSAAFVAHPLLGLAVGLGLSFAVGGAIELIRKAAGRRRAERSRAGRGQPRSNSSPTTSSRSYQSVETMLAWSAARSSTRCVAAAGSGLRLSSTGATSCAPVITR